MSSALPLLFPPQTLSERRRHSIASDPCSPPSHLSFADQNSLALEEPQTDYRTPTIRTRLSQLCREGQPHIARQVFDTLPRPTTVLWNTIIIGLICNNMPKEAILFYSRMRSSSTKCDSYTYSSALKACADTRQLKIGKAVHCHVLRSQIHAGRIVYNSLLNMYSTCLASSVNSEFFQVDLVHRVFHTMKKRNVVAWNIMISWYVKTERFRLAVVQFMRMMKMGIEPTAVSFVNVFPAISRLHALKVAGVLYGLLIKFGSDFFRDLFVVSSAISMYSEMGYTEWARKIFDGCLEKNPEVWNTMIGGYAQNYQYIEALELFIDALKSEHTSLDDLTFVAALNAVSQLQQLHIGKQVHAYIIKTPMDFSVTLINAVVVMYSRCSSIVESFNVFREMPERDNVSWNTMITALVHNGLDEEALMLVNEMQKEGFVIDSVTATALLSASSNCRSLSIGKQTHTYLIRHGIQFDGMHSYIIDMYAKCGSIEKAQWLFDDMNDHHRDQATWNAMISGNVQNGLIDEAFVVFGLMIERNVMPNAVTITSILPACSIGGIAFGKQLHGFSIRHSIDCSVFVGTALVDMYSKSGTVAYAENVFSTMIVKNSVTYTNMILGYAQHGMGAPALSLFHSMRFSGVKPDAITFVAALSACSYTGLVDEGLQIFYSMEEKYGIKRLAEHYCCVVDMLGRIGRLAEAFQFAKELVKEEYAVRAWGSLLAACKIHGQHELAKIVADKLLELKVGYSMSGYLVLLSNIYADEENWEYVDRVRKDMQERGLRKGVGYSWIEIGGHINRFVSKDQNHEKCKDIYKMLEILAAGMRDGGLGSHRNSQINLVSGTEE